MSKNLGNNLLATDLIIKGYDPLSLRYLILTSHYKTGLNFTWESLKASQVALNKLRSLITQLRPFDSSQGFAGQAKEYREKFLEALNDDLNTPQALAVLWEMVKSNIPGPDKYDLALSFDEVLGLELNKAPRKVEIPEEIKKLIERRNMLRKEGKFEDADRIRKVVEEKGFNTQDEKIS